MSDKELKVGDTFTYQAANMHLMEAPVTDFYPKGHPLEGRPKFNSFEAWHSPDCGCGGLETTTGLVRRNVKATAQVGTRAGHKWTSAVAEFTNEEFQQVKKGIADLLGPDTTEEGYF